MDERFLRDEICRVGKSLFDRGYAHGTAGNISARLEDGYLITPTDACLGFLDPARLSKVDREGAPISGECSCTRCTCMVSPSRSPAARPRAGGRSGAGRGRRARR